MENEMYRNSPNTDYSNIEVLYIDDSIDLSVSTLLRRFFPKHYDELKFSDDMIIDNLLNHDKVKKADLVIVDSRLFERKSKTKNKFLGEDFRLLLKDAFPFKECIVITQYNQSGEGDDLKSKAGTIQKKTDPRMSDTAYWTDIFKPNIDSAVDMINKYKVLYQLVSNNKDVNLYTLERLEERSKGELKYESLKVEDIDRIVDALKDVEQGIISISRNQTNE